MSAFAAHAAGANAKATQTSGMKACRETVAGIKGVKELSASGSYSPAILGGGRSIMVAELVYLRMFQSPDWGLGAAVSVVLVLIVALLMAALFRLARPALFRGAR